MSKGILSIPKEDLNLIESNRQLKMLLKYNNKELNYKFEKISLKNPTVELVIEDQNIKVPYNWIKTI